MRDSENTEHLLFFPSVDGNVFKRHMDRYAHTHTHTLYLYNDAAVKHRSILVLK